MPLHQRIGDLLDAEEEAVIIAVDGDHPKLIGAVGHKFQARIDDPSEWARIMRDAKFPLKPGEVSVVSVKDVPEVEFRYVIFACMYSHRNPDVYLRQAYYNALAYASNWGIKTVATALYRGGWRGEAAAGLAALEAACARVPEVNVVLYELRDEEASR